MQCRRAGLWIPSKTKPILQLVAFILYTVGESIPTVDWKELQDLLDQFHSEEVEVNYKGVPSPRLISGGEQDFTAVSRAGRQGSPPRKTIHY